MSNRLRLPVGDLVLALAVAALGLTELVRWHEWSSAPRWSQVAGVAVVSASLIMRRRMPELAVAVIAVGVGLLLVGGDPPQILAAGVVGMTVAFSLANGRDGRRLWIAAGVLASALVTRDIVDPRLNGFDIVIDAGVFSVPFILGRLVRRKDRRVALVAAAGEDRARDAVRLERDRIARELHDIIAHGLTTMVVQADAARHGLPTESSALTTLASIERTGRAALRDMRRLLDVMRTDGDDPPDLAPQPGLSGIAQLARSVRRAGLPVEVRVHGEPGPLSPGIDLAAYRIVQEGLTNVLRHAGSARAQVDITYSDRSVDVRIEDDGRGAAHPGSGAGLAGMRERARMYGGSVDAAPGGRGFVVSASLPREIE